MKEITVRNLTIALLGMLCLSLAVGAGAAQKDDPSCKDHPLFPTRIPGAWIHHCDHKSFDAFAFTVAKGKTEKVEGELWKISYYPQADAKEKPSELQILRNYENAVTKAGGTVIYSEKSRESFKLNKDGKEIWVEVGAEFTGKYGLTIVQKKSMAQDVVADAAAFGNDIRATGHAAVYGILFDTGKATIKPESAQAIGEVAKLLKADAGLKLFVVGHTDSAGTVDGNAKLSQDRAQSVMQALVKDHGIAASRLRAAGCGQYAPVATNDTEEGRAKNRRVELVKQ
jgi:OmpA-OmpF porin, OOP family